MLHDLSSRSTLPKLLPAFPIRYGPVILIPFAKQTSSRNTALRALSPNTQLLLRHVAVMRHMIISPPHSNHRKFNFDHESDFYFYCYDFEDFNTSKSQHSNEWISRITYRTYDSANHSKFILCMHCSYVGYRVY